MLGNNGNVKSIVCQIVGCKRKDSWKMAAGRNIQHSRWRINILFLEAGHPGGNFWCNLGVFVIIVNCSLFCILQPAKASL